MSTSGLGKVGRLGAKALRWAAVKAVSVISPVRRITVDQTTYFISRTDDYISNELRRKGGYHRERLDGALRLLQERRGLTPDGVILNLGAHIGTVLIPALQTGMFQKGLAIEPAPENAELLKRNLSANGLSDSARVARIAVGDKVSQAVLHLSRTNTANHTFCENKLVWNLFRPKVTVNMTTIDQLLVDFGIHPQDISFVVMDIQGYEEQAMAGGDSLFSQSPPLMMELDHHYIENQQKLRTLCQLLECYYECFFDLDDRTLTAHCITSLDEHFGTFSDYRDMLFL